jgi:hypothetical protein
VQKFLVIPLIILIAIQGVFELLSMDENSVNTEFDVVAGFVFIVTTIIVGFWGIPVLQSQKNGWLKKIGFIVFWTIGFYILTYILIFIFSKIILGVGQLSDTTLSLILLFSFIFSLFLGIFEKLPFMLPKSSS